MLRRLFAGCFGDDEVGFVTLCKGCTSCISNDLVDDKIKISISPEANTDSRYLVIGQNISDDVLPTFHQAAFRGMLERCNGPAANVACVVEGGPLSIQRGEQHVNLPGLRTLWLHVHTGNISGPFVPDKRPQRSYESYLMDLESLTTHDETILAGVESAARCAVNRHYCRIQHRVRLDGAIATTSQSGKGSSAGQYAILEVVSCVLDMGGSKRRPGLVLIIRTPVASPPSTGPALSAAEAVTEACAATSPSPHPLSLLRHQSPWHPLQPRLGAPDSITSSSPGVNHPSLPEGLAASCTTPAVAPAPPSRSQEEASLAGRALAAEALPAMVVAFSFDRMGAGSIIYANQFARSYLNIRPAAGSRGVAGPFGDDGFSPGAGDLGAGSWQLPPVDVRLLLMELLSGAGLSFEELLHEAAQQQGFSATIRAPAAVDVIALANGRIATRGDGGAGGVSSSADQLESMHRGGGACTARHRLLMNGIAECDEVELQDAMGEEPPAAEGAEDDGEEGDNEQTDPGHRMARGDPRDFPYSPSLDREASTSERQSTSMLRGGPRPGSSSLVGHVQRQGSATSSIGVLGTRAESFALPNRMDSSIMNPAVAPGLVASASASSSHGYGLGYAFGCPPEALRQRLAAAAAAAAAGAVQDEGSEQLLLQRLTKITVARQARDVTFQRVASLNRQTTSPPTMLSALSASSSDRGGADQQQQQQHRKKVGSVSSMVPLELQPFALASVVGPQRQQCLQQWQQQQEQQQQIMRSPVVTSVGGDGNRYVDRRCDTGPGGGSARGVSTGSSTTMAVSPGGRGWMDPPVSLRRHVGRTPVSSEFPSFALTSKSLRGWPNTRQLLRQTSNIETAAAGAGAGRDAAAMASPLSSISSCTGQRLQGRVRRSLRRVCTVASSELSMRVAALGGAAPTPLYTDGNALGPGSAMTLGTEAGIGAVMTGASANTDCRQLLRGPNLLDLGGIPDNPGRLRGGAHGSGTSPAHWFCRQQQADERGGPDSGPDLHPKEPPDGVAGTKGKLNQLAVCSNCPSAPEPAAAAASRGVGSRTSTAGPPAFPKSQRRSLPATPLAAGSAEAAMTTDCYTGMSGTSCLSPWGLRSSDSAQAGSSSRLAEPCVPRGCAAAYSSEVGSVPLLASVAPMLPSAAGGPRTRTMGILRSAQHLTAASSPRSSTEVISRMYGSDAPAAKVDRCQEERGGQEDDSAALDGERTMQLALSLALPQEMFEGAALAVPTTVVGAAGSGRSAITAVACPSTNASFPTLGSALGCNNGLRGHAQVQGQGQPVHCGNSWQPLYPVSMEGASGHGLGRIPQVDTRIDEGQMRQGRSHNRGLRLGQVGLQSHLQSPRADASGISLAPGSSGVVNDVGTSIRGRGDSAGVHSSSLVSSCWLATAVPTAMGSSGQLADISLRAAANSVERGGRMFAGAGGGFGISRASASYHLLMLRGGSTSQHPGLQFGSHLGSTMIDGSIGDLGLAAIPGTPAYCRMGATAAGGGSGGAGGGTCENSVGGVGSASASATAALFLSTADRSLMNKLVATVTTADGSCGADSGHGMEDAGGGGSGSGRAASPAAAVGLSLTKTAPWAASGSRGLTDLVTGPSGALSISKRPASIPRSCSRLHTGPAALGSATSQKRPNSVRTRLRSLLEQMDRDDGFGGYGGESPLGGLSPTRVAGGGGDASVDAARGDGTSGITNFMLYGNTNSNAQGRRASAVLSTSVSPLAALLPTRRASTTMLEKSTTGVPFSGHLKHMMIRDVTQLGAAGSGPGAMLPARASFCSAASSEIQSGASRLLLQTRASSIGPSNLSYVPNLRDLPHQSHSHVNTNTSDGSLNTTQSLALHLRLVTSGGCNTQYQQHMQQRPHHNHHHHQQLGCGDNALQVDNLGGLDTGTLPGLGLPDVPSTPTGAAMRRDPFSAGGGVGASSAANAITAAGGAGPNWVLPYPMSVSHGGAPSSAGCAAMSSGAGGGVAESPALGRTPVRPTLGDGAERRATLALTLPEGPERLMRECFGGPGIGFLSRSGSAGHGAAAPLAADPSLELRGASSAAALPDILSLGPGAVSGATSWFRVHLRSFPASEWPVGSRDPGAAGSGTAGGAAFAGGGEGGAGVTTLLLVMQDVTVHLTAQERVAALLGHEHKILEALFPRHVIEFMTVVPVEMASAGVRGRAGGGTRSRVRSRRCFTAESPASSPQQGANQNSKTSDDGGDAGGDMSTGPNADRGSHPSGDDGGKVNGSGSSSSCRRSEWRQLVMQQQLDAIKVSHLATWHKMVTILFSDCVGFTAMCKKVAPLAVMHFLNELYQKLDALLDIYKVYKVETIGDCYVVAGGLVRYDSDGYCSVLPEGEVDELHAVRVMEFGKAMLRASKEVALPTTGQPVQMRLGLHSGPAMSGVVGSKMPRFTVFGETVELAHRMESGGVPGRIHVSGATRELLRKETWEQTEGLLVDDGKRMDTYLWVEEQEDVLYKQRVMAVYL